MDLFDQSWIERHPPERGGPRKKSIVVYSCCCCCCCCLHSVGAAIGAALGAIPGSGTPSEKPTPVDNSAPSGHWLFWSSFLLLLVLGLGLVQSLAMIASLGQSQPVARAVDVGLTGSGGVLLSVVLAGPLWFLAAAILMAIRIAFHGDPDERGGYWRQLAWIVGGIFFGTIVGIAVMWLAFIAMTIR